MLKAVRERFTKLLSVFPDATIDGVVSCRRDAAPLIQTLWPYIQLYQFALKLESTAEIDADKSQALADVKHYALGQLTKHMGEYEASQAEIKPAERTPLLSIALTNALGKPLLKDIFRLSIIEKQATYPNMEIHFFAENAIQNTTQVNRFLAERVSQQKSPFQLVVEEGNHYFTLALFPSPPASEHSAPQWHCVIFDSSGQYTSRTKEAVTLVRTYGVSDIFIPISTMGPQVDSFSCQTFALDFAIQAGKASLTTIFNEDIKHYRLDKDVVLQGGNNYAYRDQRKPEELTIIRFNDLPPAFYRMRQNLSALPANFNDQQLTKTHSGMSYSQAHIRKSRPKTQELEGELKIRQKQFDRHSGSEPNAADRLTQQKLQKQLDEIKAGKAFQMGPEDKFSTYIQRAATYVNDNSAEEVQRALTGKKPITAAAPCCTLS